MKKFIKWFFIIAGCLIVLVIASLIIIPMFVDVQKYKPIAEKQVAEATGRSFSIGDVRLSLFPLARMSFSDLHLGNPEGFSEKDFLSIKSFDIRIKLMPLLTSLLKDIQVKQFSINEPRIVLEMKKDGSASWKDIGKPSGEKKAAPAAKKETPTAKKPTKAPEQALPVESLIVDQLAVANGSLIWIDHKKKERHEVSDLDLTLTDVSLLSPVQLDFSALIDGKHLAMKGSIGPIGQKPGTGKIDMDLSIQALKELKVFLKGHVTDPKDNPQFMFNIDIPTFSGRKLLAALNMASVFDPADPAALKRLSLKSKIQGDTKKISISDGALTVDESHFQFSMAAKEFSRPNIVFNMNLDQIDADRYMPAKSSKKKEASQAAGPSKSKKKSASPKKKKKPDYAPLRKLVLISTIKAGRLKINNAKLSDIKIIVSARNGVIRANPFDLKLYGGAASTKADLNVQKNTPRCNLNLKADNIQAGPLLRDVIEKDILEGTTTADLVLSFTGDDAASIKRNLNGNGDILFKDGAIKGIDLANMVRNVKSAFSLERIGEEGGQTDFTELHSPLTIRKGIVNTSNTTLQSPAADVLVTGNANLNTQELDFRVEPKMVFVRKKKDKEKKTEILVPILVTGTFSDPKFLPDLESLAKQQLEEEVIEKQLEKIFKKEKYKPYEDTTRKILKGIFK